MLGIREGERPRRAPRYCKRVASAASGILLSLIAVVPSVEALEAWDGRLQMHGFY